MHQCLEKSPLMLCTWLVLHTARFLYVLPLRGWHIVYSLTKHFAYVLKPKFGKPYILYIYTYIYPSNCSFPNSLYGENKFKFWLDFKEIKCISKNDIILKFWTFQLSQMSTFMYPILQTEVSICMCMCFQKLQH